MTSAGGWRTKRFSTSNDGNFRSPNSQQGYSPFSTWTRGLAWAMCGFAEQLEFLDAINDAEITPLLLEAAQATCDFYIDRATAADGIPYWDTGAPESPPARRLAIASRGTDQSLRTRGQLGGGHRRARPAPLGPIHEKRALLAGGPDRARLAVGRALSEHRCKSSRADPSQHISSAQRLGLSCPRDAAFPAANRACGAITTPAKQRFTSSGSPKTNRTLRFGGNIGTVPTHLPKGENGTVPFGCSIKGK